MATFYEDQSKVLTQDAFDFVLESELKRAVRSQNSLMLVTIEADAADEDTLRAVAKVIGDEVRDTDLIGHADRGTLAVALLDAGVEHSERVINRLVSRMDRCEFATPPRIALGAACYPTDAVDADSLKRLALAHPIVRWRASNPADS